MYDLVVIHSRYRATYGTGECEPFNYPVMSSYYVMCLAVYR